MLAEDMRLQGLRQQTLLFVAIPIAREYQHFLVLDSLELHFPQGNCEKDQLIPAHAVGCNTREEA